MKQENKLRRKARTRAKIAPKRVGKEEPRLSVFRSNKHITAQIIDDKKRATIVYVSDVHLDEKFRGKKTREVARAVGIEVARRAIAKKIKSVVFDRGSYKYHGRVKALAEGAREGGLIF